MGSSKSRFLLAGMILSVASAISGSGIAHAQDGSDSLEASGDGGGIIVTAQRRSESLSKVPLTINAVNAESLEKAGVVNAQALQAVIPGLVFNNIGATASVYIRGIGTRVANAGLEPSIATYQDDRYISGSNGPLFELLDIERVEVVKGPQGVLFGRNATGGAVRVITKDVEDDFGGNVMASYGNYNDYQLRGAVNIPLGDEAGLRVAAMTHQHDGYEKNLVSVGRREMNDKNVSAVRAKLKVEPSETVTLRLTFDALRQDDTIGSAVVAAPPYDLNPLLVGGATTGTRQGEFASAINNSNKIRSYGLQFRADVDLGFADFASMTTFGDNKTSFITDGDGTEVVGVDLDGTMARNESFSQEVQLVSSGDQAVDWMVGAIYYHNKGSVGQRVGIGALTVTTIGDQTAWTDSYAGFGQVTWHLNDQISLIAGGRYTHDRIRVHLETTPGIVNTFATPLVLPYLPYDRSVSFSKFTPKAAIQWNIDSERMLYASYSRGFKSGGFANPAVPANPALITDPTVKPEVLDNYEIGLKGTVGRTLSFALSGFYYDYKDLQVSTVITPPGGGLLSVTNNAASATVKGIEWESTLRPVRNFSITAGLSYIDGKYDKYPTAVGGIYRGDLDPSDPRYLTGLGIVSGVPFDASGMRMLRLPRFSGSVTANLDVPLETGVIQTSATYSFKSRYDFDFVLAESTENLRQPGYGLLSGVISYAPDSSAWKVSVYGTNLLDKTYTNLRQTTGLGTFWGFGDPRTYGVRVEANF